MKKLTLICFFIAGLHLFEACCPDAPPYFDYASLEISNLTVGYAQGQFYNMRAFQISPKEVSYIADNSAALTNSAWATSCPFPGDHGGKYPIKDFEIVSDQIFNDTLPAGALLNALFYYHSLDTAGYKAVPLLSRDSSFDFFYDHDILIIGTPELPKDTTLVHTIQVKITKSDGSVATGSLSGVKFN